MIGFYYYRPRRGTQRASSSQWRRIGGSTTRVESTGASESTSQSVSRRGRTSAVSGAAENLQVSSVGAKAADDQTQIPQSVVPTMQRLLGDDIVSIGYWFGLSAAEGGMQRADRTLEN